MTLIDTLLTAGSYLVPTAVAFIAGTVYGQKMMAKAVRKQALKQMNERFEEVAGPPPVEDTQSEEGEEGEDTDYSHPAFR
jgi:hypothetical protein